MTNKNLKDIKEIIKCYFCQIILKTDKNHYLKNRYKIKFWNGNADDIRTICYICLKYSFTRKLPVIKDKKRGIFLEYERKAMFGYEYKR
jgi:hypothetical protein